MLILLIQLGLAGAIAGAVFIRGVWPFEPAAGLLTQLGLGALALAIASLAVGAPAGAGLLLAAAALAFWQTREAVAAPSPEIGDAEFKVLWSNLFMRQKSLEASQRLALSEGADVAAFAEFPEGGRLLAEFEAAFPHRFPEALTDRQDTILFSRFPFLSTRTISLWRRPSLVVRIETAGGPLTVVAVHAPVPWTPGRQSLQHRQIAETFAAIEAAPPFIIVGDFNAAPWSAVLNPPPDVRRLSLGRRSTWMSPLPLLGIPIDHAFVSKDLCGSVALGPATGSDHRPIVVSARPR
jgi:endonuclease/exonuclease/phosphatase (EEP) superfamily protein YafD